MCYGTGVRGGCFSREGGGDGEDGEAVADLVLMLLIVILLKMLLLLVEVISGKDIRGLSQLRVKVLSKKVSSLIFLVKNIFFRISSPGENL